MTVRSEKADLAEGASADPHADSTIDLERATVRHGLGLEHLVRPLLSALTEIGQFDAAYLTTIDWEHRRQQVRYARNVNGIEMPEGHHIDWPEDLSEQAFIGVTRSHDLPTVQPDSLVASRLGLGTYVSVPVITIQHQLFGTLCGASSARRDVPDGTVSVMEYFARLIADHLHWAEAERTAHRAELAEEQLRERALFLAEAEHKLKTPLTVITGYVATLRQHASTLSERDTAAALDTIDRNTKRLTEQINGLLEEALAEFKAHDLRPEPVDVCEAMRTITAAYAASGGRDVQLDDCDDVWVDVDPAVLDQLVGHLLDNATKYSPPGTPLIVRVRRDDGWVDIDVIDEGIGIPPDVDVFGAFQRGANDVVQAAPGVGLGLHIVSNLAQAVGGEVSARRNPDRGSTFTVRMPMAPS